MPTEFATGDPMIEELLERLAPNARSRTEQLIKAVQVTGIPERRWYRMLRAGRVYSQADCFRLEDLTGIPARQLAGYEGASGPDGSGRGRSKRPRRGVSALAPVARSRAVLTGTRAANA